MAPKKSLAWDHFVDQGKNIAECKVCKVNISYKSGVSNLTKHIRRKHISVIFERREQEDENQQVQEQSLTNGTNDDSDSALWTLFTKKEGFLATCNTCHNDYSFRASVSNLRKHWYRKHGGRLSNDTSMSDRNSDDSDEEQEKAVAEITDKKPKATWNYFTVTDTDKYEATCKICDKTVSYEFVSELTQHLRDHGEKPKDSDDEDSESEVRQRILKRKYKSEVWNYFEVTDDKMAVCLLCKQFLNYASTISNLKKHLKRKHKEITFNQNHTAKRIYLNGELYEIANEEDQEENDSNVETIEMDPIYLSSDSIDKLPTPTKKQPKIPPKRNFSKILEEPVHSTKITCSEVPELPRKEIPSYTPNPMGSIDYFGQYVVSLLKDLPKPVSDQLQGEIIKQIFTSKMALDSQTVAASYEIKICQNDKNVTNVPEPVCYTVVQTNEDAEKLHDDTGSAVQE